MKFVKALSASYEVFFQGRQGLLFPLGTSELTIREYIESQHSGGNWQRSSLVLTETKLKEKVFEKECVRLN